METLDIKFTKFDNRPWGFRLAGGSDFPQPLTVIRVSEGSLSECMGLKVGDVVVKLNDQPISELTHGQAHEALMLAGNNFVLGVRRTADPDKLIEGIEEKVEPYMLPIEEILFAPADEQRETTPDEAPQIEDESVPTGEQEPQEEIYPEKPRDENSDPLPKTDLTEEEIAQLILDEEEVLNEKGVLGVNFKKLRPRAPLLKESKVFKELQQEIDAEPESVQELKRQSTFLKKPERPVPKSRRTSESEDGKPEPEPYRVVIKKQPRKPITQLLLQKGLIDPKSLTKTPEPSESETPAATPEPSTKAQTPEPGSRPQSQAEVIEIVESTESETKESREGETPQPEPRIEEPTEDEDQPVQVVIRRPSKDNSKTSNSEVDVEVAVTMDRDKIKELVTTEISLERQLESVQSQLLALKQLPTEIEKHLKIVSDQLHKIMELSGVDQQQVNGKAPEQAAKEAEDQARQEEAEEQRRRDQQSREREEEEQRQHEEEQQQLSEAEDGRRSAAESHTSSSWAPNLVSEDDTWTESKELEISVKSNESDKRVKKYIVSYESKVIEETRKAQQRSPSPAVSQRSFEADPNLTLHDQLVEELKHRKGRKRSRELWQPQAKQLELTYGRKWRCPNDFFNDEMIADVLSSQAEVIRGRALGVNFKKFEKKALPNYDHLMNSSVYKMIHHMEAEPKKGIPARPPKVIAAEDIIERVGSPDCACARADRERSVSH